MPDEEPLAGVPVTNYRAHAVAFVEGGRVTPSLAWSATCAPCDANFTLVGDRTVRRVPTRCPYCGRDVQDVFERDEPGGIPIPRGAED